MRKSSKDFDQGFQEDITPSETSVKIGGILEIISDHSYQVGIIGIGILILMLTAQFLGLGLLSTSLIFVAFAALMGLVSYKLTTGYWVPEDLFA